MLVNAKRGGGGGKYIGEGFQVYQIGKMDFELGVGVEGQDTPQHFEGSFGFISEILYM